MNLERKFSTIISWELLVPILAVISLLLSCIIISFKKFFWIDELFSYYLLSDQSFTHMMSAFSDKFNSTPPLYFVLGWFWDKVFGSSELSLRLFSSLGVGIACAITWVTLRCTYNFWPTTVGTLSVFSLSGDILYQNAEARMYGLFLAVCSFGLLQFDAINRKQKLPNRVLYLNAFVNAAIVQTHLYGIFYSGAILFAFIARDKCSKIFRPKIYLSIVLSWISLIPYIPSFLNQADAGNPRSWIPIPDLQDLIQTFNPSSLILYMIVLLILISVWQFICQNNNAINIGLSKQANPNAEISLLILAFAFLAVPILSWIISHVWKPIFINRYMIPSALSWSILIAYLITRIILPISTSSKLISLQLNFFEVLVNISISILLITLTAILLIYPIRYAERLQQEQLACLDGNNYGYRELPIVVDHSHYFVKCFHYSPERIKYFFILDWQAALEKGGGLFSPQEYKVMDALKRNYPNIFRDNIIQSEDFFQKYDNFLVLAYSKKCTSHDIHCPKWFEKRIRRNADYVTTKLDSFDNMDLLVVESKK